MTSEELSEDENQLLWKYATEDVNTEELALIEELQSNNATFAAELADLEAQKAAEAERREKVGSGSGGLFWVALVVVGALIGWWLFS